MDSVLGRILVLEVEAMAGHLELNVYILDLVELFFLTVVQHEAVIESGINQCTR
jgi:hypothetical protein